ncbi:gamma carbonic anhydrase family protein [Neobacillus sp. NPDC093182]|uniref:gamma carbonic anhydrase family protein n=1 Tax=Neobacillus sp. NPDC093182 TaxID=3364297 RepID=UPI0037F97644
MLYKYKGICPDVHSSSYIAPGAQLIGNIELKEDTSVWFNAVLRGDNEKITIGKGSNIQDGAIVHVDPGYPVHVGEYVTIGHNVVLHGCTVKDEALIGMGATILNGAVIGEGALVAAGALVPEGKMIAPGVLVAGVPAKVIRALTQEQTERSKQGALQYVQNGANFRDENIVELENTLNHNLR